MTTKRYLALCGGVGGAKLALGLSRILDPDDLTIAVNTGDDFEHFGLTICPDLDTVTYTLAGLAHPVQGWGRDAETFHALDTLQHLGGDTWFRLGDRDIGLHLMRRMLLDAGLSLGEATTRIAAGLGVAHKLVPMSEEPVRTVIDTDEGQLAFQHYFVRHGCRPVVTGIRYLGAESATPAPALAAALSDPCLAGIVICPSNPYLSIDPILAVPGIRRALAARCVPVVAVAPLIDGKAVKGPTAKIMRELGIEVSAAAVAIHYSDFLDGYLASPQDAPAIRDVRVAAGNVVMNSLEDKIDLARRSLMLLDDLGSRR